uniref:protein-tyrosine-phosphatase n=1 Tax=Alexandrium monilatum TaxID=311494 RepID=A0A7S4V277_9DINO|mmetsp:Transcript_107398/g.342185  ORF Transcript_107398/g.342185 Transcript_107398/m.342185 type:complete len:467 (+) Transcript_107398:169-1569(+)
MEREVVEAAIEFQPDRLYWTAVCSPPKSTARAHYFCIDNDLVYEPFFADFGPLSLSMVHRYCKMLAGKLMDPGLADKRIVHFCSHDPKKRTNAAFLMCAYQLVVLGKPAELAFDPIRTVHPPFTPFRDATCGVCNFHLTILDCLKGLEESMKLRWYDVNRFNVDSYEFYGQVENGDMNWVIPDKFLAFAGPCPNSIDPDGYPAFTPEDYVPIFREAAIWLVVRLNKKQYDRRRFIDHGLKHVDLYFLDGSCPSREIISKFLHITESEPGAVAVHCKAGLGRTGTLIGLYAMKHFQFPARAFIGWNRICRPGSILGPQQQFLIDMQHDMFQAGAAMRRPVAPPRTDTERALAQQLETMTMRERSQAEMYEDAGQGERLINAKRNPRGAPALGDNSNNNSFPPRQQGAPAAGNNNFLPHMGQQQPQMAPGHLRDAHGANPELPPRPPPGRDQRAGGITHRSLLGIFSL